MNILTTRDDDPDIRLQLKAILEAYRFTVETAANGQEALERIKAMVPDGIFLDLRMPVMDGFTTLDVLRREYPSITVIAITASMPDDVVRHVRARGAHGCLVKPFDLQALRAVLHDAFGWTPAPAE